VQVIENDTGIEKTNTVSKQGGSARFIVKLDDEYEALGMGGIKQW
jgi:hypothetical protein